MKVFLTVLFTISIIQIGQAQNWVQKGLDIDGEAALDESGYSVSLCSDANTVAIGAPLNDGSATDAGHVRVYSWNGIAWIQKGTDIDGEAASDQFGKSVSLSSDGNTVAIGAPFNNGNGSSSGHVQVFAWSGSMWTQKGLDIDGEAIDDCSGWSVSLSADGNTVAIGAPFNDGNGISSGQTRVYSWNGSAWIQKGADLDGELAADQSGFSVSLSSNGNTVAIGAPGNDENGSNSGHTRVYSWNGSSWDRRGKDLDGEMIDDNSGYSVSLNSDGNFVAIGAPWNDGGGSNAGHVRIYRWNSHIWVQQGLDIDGEATGDHSGFAVSLNSDANYVAIGAIMNSENGVYAGHTLVYHWNSTSWVQKGQDIDGETDYDESGCSVSINSDGSAVAIGAHDNNENGTHSGQTRVYEYDINISINESDYPVLTVLPNPNDGIFSLVNLHIGSHIRIYNTLGQLIFQTEAIDNNMNFDLSNYKKGIYLLYNISEQDVKMLDIIIQQ